MRVHRMTDQTMPPVKGGTCFTKLEGPENSQLTTCTPWETAGMLSCL